MPLYNPSTAGGSITVKEIDGTPSVTGVTTIRVSNTTLTDDTGGQVSVTTAGAGVTADELPWSIVILPTVHAASATVGTWSLLATRDAITTPFLEGLTSQGFSGLHSSGAQNDAISWPVVLAAGTWTVRLHFRKSTNTGIFTVNFDGSSQGTIDSYAAAVAYGDSSITGIVVGTTGKKVVQLLMATKNASSSSYYGELLAVAFLRTA